MTYYSKGGELTPVDCAKCKYKQEYEAESFVDLIEVQCGDVYITEAGWRAVFIGAVDTVHYPYEFIVFVNNLKKEAIQVRRDGRYCELGYSPYSLSHKETQEGGRAAGRSS